MAIKHIIKFQARASGNTIEEEKRKWEIRKMRQNENTFNESGLERYLRAKAQNQLRGILL